MSTNTDIVADYAPAIPRRRGTVPRRTAFASAILLSSGCLSSIAHGARGTQEYHPGYSAHHVTRLHRWDHSGVESMLEAESWWNRRLNAGEEVAEVLGRGSQRRLSHSQAPLESELPRQRMPKFHRRWLRISQAQAEGLLQHHAEEVGHSTDPRHSQLLRNIHAFQHEQTGVLASSLLNRTEAASVSAFERADSGTKVEYTVSDEKMPAGAPFSRQDLRRHLHRSASPVRGGMAVTGLTSLSSQYVGPIGVGTVVAPTGCVIHNGQALRFLDPAAEERQKKACHLENESQVWVVFDTGSTNIWVSSDLCRYGACVKQGRHRYNHTRSSTYDWPLGGLELTVQFGTGCIKGPQAKDDFHIGPFTVFDQTFGMIETQNGSVFNEVPFEGILGLAFSAMSANGVTPFFDSIIQQKALVHNEFAFYFSVDSVTANAVFWGGVDPAFFEGQIQYYPVVDPFYWAVELISFKVGDHYFTPDGLDDEDDDEAGSDKDPDETAAEDTDNNVNVPGLNASGLREAKSRGHARWNAIVDTGTTFFTAEGSMYTEILNLLQPVKCNEMNAESHPPITYRLRSAGGKPTDFVLDNHQYMSSGSSDPDAVCTAAFMRIDIPKAHGPAMVLGECFLRHYYAVFDRADGDPKNARVGFAKSRHDQTPIKQLMRLTHGQQYFQLPESKD